MSISIAEAIYEGAKQLREAGVPEPRREAGSLIAHVLERDRAFIITHAENLIPEQQLERFREWLKRRANGEPLQYLTGHQEFFGLDFEVTKDVLIPRPETELLIEAAVKLSTQYAAAPFFCDVGTGSGCIALTLLHEIDGARAVAIDISTSALAVAKRNAVRLAVDDRVQFVAADCFSAFATAGPPFDLIVSNPPYVKESALAALLREVRDFEPRGALAAGEDGLVVIRNLLLDAVLFLKTGGHLLFEIGFDQAAAVEELIDPNIWKLLEIHKDLQSIPRTVALQKVS